MGDLPDMGADDDDVCGFPSKTTISYSYYELTNFQDDDELPDLEDDKTADKPTSTEEVKEDQPKSTATSSKIQEVS